MKRTYLIGRKDGTYVTVGFRYSRCEEVDGRIVFHGVSESGKKKIYSKLREFELKTITGKDFIF